MAALYADENFPQQVVDALRGLGHDVLTARGRTGQPGHRRRRGANRRDFVALHKRSAEHAGIVVCSQDPDTDGQARRIDEALSVAGTLRARLLRVNRPPA